MIDKTRINDPRYMAQHICTKLVTKLMHLSTQLIIIKHRSNLPEFAQMVKEATEICDNVKIRLDDALNHLEDTL